MTHTELCRRTKDFALAAARVARTFAEDVAWRHAAVQLTRASASVAANYRAAGLARSRKEFVARMGLVIEEADECVFWLEYVQGLPSAERASPMLPSALDESRQLVRCPDAPMSRCPDVPIHNVAMDFVSIAPANLVALAIATSFAAGLNVSATVATIGLLGRYGYVDLPPALHLVEDPLVIGVALVVFLFEFVFDKVPVVDLVWNALQTFIRVPAGALLAYGATAQLSPGDQLMAAALGAVVALGAHAGKAALRTGVTLSPEPFTNALVSLGEDALAVGVTWFATQHPLLAATIALVWIALVVLFIRWVWNGLRRLFANARQGS